MLQSLLQPEVQQFIRDHENSDVNQLLLKHKEILGVPASEIVHQIAGLQKIKKKLPTFHQTSGLIYPPVLNLEQSSSETTARFKKSLIQEGNVGADLSAGFGVDSFFLSSRFREFHYVEPNVDLAAIARHNHHVLGAKNIVHHASSAEDFLSSITALDFVFIDPSRRQANQKVFTLNDSAPNIIELQSIIFQKANVLMIKAAPMLDITVATRQLQFVKSVIVLAVDNEVKELLFVCEKDFAGEPVISAINLQKEKDDRFDFTASEEHEADLAVGELSRFLYEPNSAVLKAGAFKLAGNRFGFRKLHASTHLYTSPEPAMTFPGRIFEIRKIVKADAKVVRHELGENKANVMVRNYPQSAEELKKKLQLQDGGDQYVIAFSTPKEKMVVIASRLK